MQNDHAMHPANGGADIYMQICSFAKRGGWEDPEVAFSG